MGFAMKICDAKLVVLKIGSAIIVDEDGHVKNDWIAAFADDIAALKQSGKDIIVVSSGAISLGRKYIGIDKNTPSCEIPLEQKQAASAVGQFHIFAAYHKAFLESSLNAAQVLLTMAETENRKTHLNARATISTLLNAGIVPIINENDTISTGEIRFGDNDRLAVRVAQMMDADCVVLMSTVDGMYSADPRLDKTAKHISIIDDICDEHDAMAGDAPVGASTGGMKSKLLAARAAIRAGIELIIASGVESHALLKLTEGSSRFTTFAPRENRYSARKKWIQSHLNPRGQVTVDDGAIKALKSGASLLPIGAVNVSGDFSRGDAIAIADKNGKQIGVGISAYSSADARKIAQKQSREIPKILGYTGSGVIVHSNDMALDYSSFV